MRAVGDVLAWTLFFGIAILGFISMFAFVRAVYSAGHSRVPQGVLKCGIAVVAVFAFLGGWLLYDTYWLLSRAWRHVAA